MPGDGYSAGGHTVICCLASCKLFKSNGLKITIESNKKIVNFLDVTFDPSSGRHKPYMRPNKKLLSVCVYVCLSVCIIQ